MRVWTGTTGAPATPTPSGHRLPPIPDAGPRGPAPNRRTSPPFSRQSSASGRQRFTRTPAGRRTEHPARPPPPSQGQRPTHCRGDHRPRTRREHLRDVNPNRLFAVVPLPHAATTEIFVLQVQALVTPGAQVSDDLVEAWIWWFNTHQPARGGVWVPHLGWVHMLIAPPTDPRPASSTGGRERAAPPTRPETLRIPPYKGLAV